MKHYPPLPPLSLGNSSWDVCGPQSAQGKLPCQMLRYAKYLTLHCLNCLMHRNCTVQPPGRSGAGSAAPANTIVNGKWKLYSPPPGRPGTGSAAPANTFVNRNCTVQPQGRPGAGSAAPANTIVNRNCTVQAPGRPGAGSATPANTILNKN